MRERVLSIPAIAFVCLLALFLDCVPSVLAAEEHFRNVIVLVGDGMGATHTTLARWYKGAPLSLDGMFVGGRDNEDLIEVLRSKGYALVANREEMERTASSKLWGMFANDLADIDRPLHGSGRCIQIDGSIGDP